ASEKPRAVSQRVGNLGAYVVPLERRTTGQTEEDQGDGAAREEAGRRNPTAETIPRQPRPGGGFFQGCLAESKGSTPGEHRDWRRGFYDHIGEVMPWQGGFWVGGMCQLAGVSGVGFYRHLVEIDPDEEEMELRDAIQRIYLEHRRHYGYRRITAELHH